MQQPLSRRDFIEFIGKSGASLSLAQVAFLSGCSLLDKTVAQPLEALAPSTIDDVLLAKGFQYKKMISYGDSISKTETFGDCNDFIAVLPKGDNPNQAYLWVNHEYFTPMIAFNVDKKDYMKKRTRKDIDKERSLVGGSLLVINKNNKEEWVIDFNNIENQRWDGATKIPFSNGYSIKGKTISEGTLSNCAGGTTPWNTFLTCEENVQNFYYDPDEKPNKDHSLWHKYYKNPIEHYGWVVEINPRTKKSKKHVALGRFAHECATTTISKNNKAVVYSGDDHENEHLYKFISHSHNSLDKGDLYVADTLNGKWILLDQNKNTILNKHFKNQTDVLTYCRKAGKLVGATQLDRPEDIEISPVSGEVFIALTNNIKKNNYFGSILKIKEDNNDPGSLTFKASTFLEGGEGSGFSCPDNFVFDPKGNLWLTVDVSGRKMNNPPYENFKNNGLFYIPMSGEHSGKVYQVASAPTHAEFTGPCFSPDKKTLFLSVQHPGEKSKSLDKLSSHWPDGGSALPKSSVIAISGPTMDELLK